MQQLKTNKHSWHLPPSRSLHSSSSPRTGFHGSDRGTEAEASQEPTVGDVVDVSVSRRPELGALFSGQRADRRVQQPPLQWRCVQVK